MMMSATYNLTLGTTLFPLSGLSDRLAASKDSEVSSIFYI